MGGTAGVGPNVSVVMGTVMAEGGVTDKQLKEFLTGPSYGGGGSLAGFQVNVVTPMPDEIVKAGTQPFSMEVGLGIPGLGADMIENRPVSGFRDIGEVLFGSD